MTSPETDCQWFLGCTNPATTTRPGPLLVRGGLIVDLIPVCERCAEFIDWSEEEDA